jgi:hypothetical protein
MSERGLVCTATSVRGILAGEKTETRRIAKLENGALLRARRGDSKGVTFDVGVAGPYAHLLCPYGAPGDLLWVRENWCPLEDGRAAYRADGDDPDAQWRSSRFMPKWASRIWLRITGVSFERLGAITEEGARREGIDPKAPIPARINGSVGEVHVFGPDAGRKAFALLWDGLHGRGAFAENPWVWVLRFERVGETSRRAAP